MSDFPKQNKDQGGNTTPNSESIEQKKPINRRVFDTISSLSGIVGLIVAWAVADSHHTTMIAAIIVGVILLCLPIYFHWSPGRKRIQSTSISDHSLSQLKSNNFSPSRNLSSLPIVK